MVGEKKIVAIPISSTSPEVKWSTPKIGKSPRDVQAPGTVDESRLKWPHLRLPREKGGKVPKFDNLTVSQLVRGELEIINSTYLPIPQEERSHRLLHLQNLMRLAHKHDWLDVLNFHGTVLEKIEG